MDDAIKALATRIVRWTKHEKLHISAIPGLSLFRQDEVTEPLSCMYEPSVCLVAQGTKRVLLGDESYIYDANHYLITAVHLPTVVQVITASKEKPLLGLMLRLNLREVSQLMVDNNLPLPRLKRSGRGIAVGEITEPLIGAMRRLIDLLDEKRDIPILAPIIQREIIYRLLVEDQGARLRKIATAGSREYQISRAIDWLHGNYNRQLRVKELAGIVNMSPSSFYQHFRELTGMSPLQYQKWLRLNEARRLMLIEPVDVSSASFQVGYESTSQFSREYSRLFGVSPLRDINMLRQKVVNR